ncbi:hypothetical protein EC54115_11842, partial [Escherichia coli 541-15]
MLQQSGEMILAHGVSSFLSVSRVGCRRLGPREAG